MHQNTLLSLSVEFSKWEFSGDLVGARDCEAWGLGTRQRPCLGPSGVAGTCGGPFESQEVKEPPVSKARGAGTKWSLCGGSGL